MANGFVNSMASPPSNRCCSTCSRVAHEKNIGFLLETLTYLKHWHPEILLVIAGEGPASAALKRRTTDLNLEAHARFVGYLDRSRELLDCYRAADLFVFSSRTETQGLVLLEAMALGVPVVGWRSWARQRFCSMSAAHISHRMMCTTSRAKCLRYSTMTRSAPHFQSARKSMCVNGPQRK